jgi:hypothetical protein
LLLDNHIPAQISETTKASILNAIDAVQLFGFDLVIDPKTTETIELTKKLSGFWSYESGNTHRIIRIHLAIFPTEKSVAIPFEQCIVNAIFFAIVLADDGSTNLSIVLQSIKKNVITGLAIFE